MTPDLKDHIVEFLLEGQLIFGLVTGQAMEKLQVTDANGRNRRVNARTVVVVHSVRATLSDFATLLEPLRSETGARAEEVDTELLWEATSYRSGALDPAFLSVEYFGDEDACSRSAVMRAALKDPIHFRLKGIGLFSRSREQVEQQLHQNEIEQLREDRWNAISAWLQKALANSERTATHPDSEELLDEAQKFLLSRRADPPPWLTEDEPEIWKRTPILRDFTPREAAFQLLVRAGRLPSSADPLLVLAGIEADFSEHAEAAASELASYVSDSSRTDFTDLEPIAIDDEDTLEVDDALTLQKIEAGWQVGVHIADVGHFVEHRGALFEEACARVSSLYLPHRLLTMLPNRVSCDLASLSPGELRPVVSTLIDVDDQGQVLGFRICRGQVRLKRRLTYDEVDDQLNRGTSTDLSWLSWFGGLQKQLREAQGAVTFHTPEFKVKVNGDESITVTQLNSLSPARQLVAEMMILTNSLAARYSQESGVNLVFRSQGPPKKELKIPERYDPVALREVFRSLERSRYGLTPEAHTGLGLEAYAQITSPLRRLVDLLSQIQLSAHLSGAPAVFGGEALGKIIHGVGEVERNLRAVERRAVRYYMLRHAELNYASHVFEAIVLGPADRAFQVETVEFALRGHLPKGKNRYRPGDRLEVKMDRVDLEQGDLFFRSV